MTLNPISGHANGHELLLAVCHPLIFSVVLDSAWFRQQSIVTASQTLSSTKVGQRIAFLQSNL